MEQEEEEGHFLTDFTSSELSGDKGVTVSFSMKQAGNVFQVDQWLKFGDKVNDACLDIWWKMRVVDDNNLLLPFFAGNVILNLSNDGAR